MFVLSLNVPLPPNVYAEIDSLVAGISPSVAAFFRTREIARRQAEANRKAVSKKVYREARERALSLGHPEPDKYARDRVLEHKLNELYKKRIAAISNRTAHWNRRRSNKLASKNELASKTANKNVRRLPQSDRHYVEIIGEAERYGYLGQVPLVLSKFPPFLKDYKLPHWEKTTTSLKVMAMSIEAEKEGAQTINLRINPSVRAKALASPRGPASYMQAAIRNAFRATFGSNNVPEFWFVIELDGSRADHFHLHGAVVTPNVANGVKLVDLALCGAGGGWSHQSGAVYQQRHRDLPDPIYWASYCVKAINIAGREIDRKLFASTVGIRRSAQENWDLLRASLPQPGR